MEGDKPPFDPSQPFQPVAEADKPAFDPSQPFQAAPDNGADQAKQSPDFSWSKAITDILPEIGNEAGSALTDIGNLGNRSEQGPLEGLMTTGKAALAVPRLLASPITGAARSLIGHPMANLEHKAGEYINPEVAAKDNPEQMYETAKGDVDTAMSAVRPAGAPIKVGGGYEWKGPPQAPKPTGLVKQPDTEAFFDSADNHYSNMRGYGVEIARAPVNQVADNIINELYAEGYRPRNSKVFDDVEELRHPAGQNNEISDLDSVRKVLRRTALDPSERDAARRAVGHIDDYLANLKNNPQDVVVNPHFAAQVSDEALAARGDYAVAKRSEDIDEAMDKARRQTGSAGAGGNFNNAVRQQLKSLRNNKKKMLGWSDAEKSELDSVITGSTSGNAARQAGKFAPHGIVSTVMSAGAGHALMPGVGEVAVPAAGWIAKKIGDRITRNAAERLSNVVKARSPLGKQNSVNAAAQSALLPAPTQPQLLAAGVKAGLPSPVPAINIRPLLSAQENNQQQPSSAGFARGGAVNPTDAQKEAGNYRKEHISVHGLPISIENPKGSYREGKGANGKPWRVKMPCSYGYIKRTEGADGDHVDINVGKHLKSPLVYVVDQHDHKTGKFDEHKAFIGFENAKDVKKAYHASFSDGRAGARLKHLTEMTVAQFKEWLKDGDTTRPLKKRNRAPGGPVNDDDSSGDSGGEVYPADGYDPFAAEKFVNPLVQKKLENIATLPKRAIESSQYALDSGNYDPEVPLEAAGQVIGGGTPFAVKGAAGVAGGKLMKPGEDIASAPGIRAYHGSPHDFDAFDMSKIGTGEGAQAYGHGLYLAENEGVAKSYKTAGPAANAQYDAINKRLSQLAKEMDENSSGYRNFKDKELGAKQSAEYDGLMDKKANLGHMYEVNINADPAHFLDWDKPLSEQHPATQDAVKQAMGIDYYGKPDPAKAEKLWQEFGSSQAGRAVRQGFIASDDKLVADRLRDAGIPGIKYLDQGSRNPGFSSLTPAQLDARINSLQSDIASGGGNQARMKEQLADLQRERDTYKNQSRNYVVFNDKLIDIKRKYERGGMAALQTAYRMKRSGND